MSGAADWIFRGLAAGAFLAWALPALEALLSGWRPRRLADLPVDGPAPPRLSVIVPALNEEATVEAAMRTLLALDYPDLEIVAVDDRSTDRTGELLDRIAAEDRRLKVIHVKVLPPGWLGKNHAMNAAAKEASGRYILFTDADVHFDRTALRRAVNAAEAGGLDAVVAFPELVPPGFWGSVCVWFFALLLSLRTRPWNMRNPRRGGHIGIGAFTLVRAEAYRRAGGHAAIPMEVIDDLELGRILKESGASCEPMHGTGMVRVRWVDGVGSLVGGLSKNAFAGLGYSVALAALACAGVLVMAVWPWIGLWAGPVDARALSGATILLWVVLAWPARPVPRTFPLASLLFPVAALVFVAAVIRSTASVLGRGGVSWRGTFYPLAELRRGRRLGL